MAIARENLIQNNMYQQTLWLSTLTDASNLILLNLRSLILRASLHAAQFIFLPLLSLINDLEAMDAWRAAYVAYHQDKKSFTALLVHALVQTVFAGGITVTTTGILMGSSFFIEAAPLIFTGGFALNAAYHLSASIYYGLKGDTEKSKAHAFSAFSNGLSALVTGAAAIIFKPALIVGVFIASCASLVYAGYKLSKPEVIAPVSQQNQSVDNAQQLNPLDLTRNQRNNQSTLNSLRQLSPQGISYRPYPKIDPKLKQQIEKAHEERRLEAEKKALFAEAAEAKKLLNNYRDEIDAVMEKLKKDFPAKHCIEAWQHARKSWEHFVADFREHPDQNYRVNRVEILANITEAERLLKEYDKVMNAHAKAIQMENIETEKQVDQAQKEQAAKEEEHDQACFERSGLTREMRVTIPGPINPLGFIPF